MKSFSNIFVGLAVVGVALGGYVYWSSQQKPDGVTVAEIINSNATVSGDVVGQTTGVETQSTEEGSSVGEQFSIVAGSTMGWKGTKAGGFHTGTIDIVDGFIRVDGKSIVAGEFTLDMQSILVLDIDNENFQNEIINSFFEAKQYPTSRFVIKSTEIRDNQTIVIGDLTIKDITQTISFPATITIDGDTVRATAQFAIDKTLRKLNHRDGIVNKFLEFDLNITFNKAL